MPYERPTLTAIRDAAIQDIQTANISGVDGLLQKSVLRVLAMVEAGIAYEHYGYQDWISQQAVPWTATDEHLTGWAALKAVFQKAATSTTLTAQFTGTAGVVLPTGTGMATANSISFTSTSAGTVSGTTVSVPIVSTGTGSANNLAVGTSITLSGVISGINSTGTITGIVGTPAADQETEDAFRTRMLQVYANPPQGGSSSDYVTWAEAVPGVTRAWCNPNGAGPGTVVVYPMFDLVESAGGGFPQGANGTATAEPRDASAAGDQLTVANYIYPLQPVTALVYVSSPGAQAIGFTIIDVYPFTATIQAGISAALADMLLRLGNAGQATTLYPSDWNEAVASVAGLDHFDITAPAAPVTIPVGYLPILGALSTSS